MKQKICVFLVIFIISLTFTSSNSSKMVHAYPYEIVNIEPPTLPLLYGQNMTVAIQLDCDTTVTYLKFYIYQITPYMTCLCNYRCAGMVEVASDLSCPTSAKYETNYPVEFLDEMQIGYRIQLFYENGSIVMIPKVENFMGIPTIEPLKNEIMFDGGKVQSSAVVDSHSVYFLGSLLITIALVIKFQKRKLL